MNFQLLGKIDTRILNSHNNDEIAFLKEIREPVADLILKCDGLESFYNITIRRSQ